MSSRDHSANQVLGPAILERLTTGTKALDVGCGTGWLTARAAAICKELVGIDPSEESIAIARNSHALENCNYLVTSIEDYANESRCFDTVFANMAASSAPDLKSFISSSRGLLRMNGEFIFTIPHPCFWSTYWGYAQESWFDYKVPMTVEGPFRIRGEKSKLVTTHFHRSLESYMDALFSCAFSIVEVRELSGKNFKFPRFMLFRLRAV